MNKLITHLKGDKRLWGLILLLALVSFLPIYSASSSLAYKFHGGDTLRSLSRHGFHLSIGLLFTYAIHHLHFRWIGRLNLLALPMIVVLLLITLLQGTTMGGANASRWIKIPVVGMQLQTSAFASLILMIWLARYFAKSRDYSTFQPLYKPLGVIMLVCMFILPADFSTTALIFAISMLVMLISGVPFRQYIKIIGTAVAGLSLFILVVVAFPQISNRVSTWKARIVNYVSGEEESNYQVEQAKMAIAQGQIFGKGPGKSAQKNFLPQSNSDFVYAIITDEYGLFGATLTILLYLAIFRRIFKIARRAHSRFGTLLTIGASAGLIAQALINTAVATNLLPVTGQTLPFLSAGGSSIWVTCIAFGVILSVSHTDVEKIVGSNEDPDDVTLETDNALAHE